MIVKRIGETMTIETENGKFFAIREDHRTQDFMTESDLYFAIKNRKCRWQMIKK